MMKTFFITAAIVVLSYLGFRYLPPETQRDIKAQSRSALAAVGLSNLSPDKLLPPLKAKITPIADNIVEKLKPENLVEKRAKIIDKLEKEIQTIAETPAPPTAKEKAALKAAVQESQALIQELKAENPKGGAVANAVNYVLDTVLPASQPPAKNAETCQNP